MHHRIYPVSSKRPVGHGGEGVNAHRQKVGQKAAYNAEGEPENQQHYNKEKRQGEIFVCKHIVYFYAPQVFLALPAFHDRLFADVFDKRITHIRQSGVGVKPPFGFHFLDAVFYRLKLVFVKLQLFREGHIAFNQLCRGKAGRDSALLRVVLYKVRYRVYAAVNRAGQTEVLHLRLYFLFGGGNGGVHKLADTVVFGGANRDDRYADKLGHHFDINRSAVCPDLVHHIERQHHRYAEL